MDVAARPAWQIVAAVVGFVVFLCMISFLSESAEMNRQIAKDDVSLESCMSAIREAEQSPPGSNQRKLAKDRALRLLMAMRENLGTTVLKTRHRMDPSVVLAYVSKL